MKTMHTLTNEIRYSIRLTQRTARFYRKLEVIGMSLTLLGGSAIMASIADTLPEFVSQAGACVLAIAGVFLFAIRPADKAAINESDVRRYQQLMAKAETATNEELSALLHQARVLDAPEFESMRDIAYNDILNEMGYPETKPLSVSQKILKLLA